MPEIASPHLISAKRRSLAQRALPISLLMTATLLGGCNGIRWADASNSPPVEKSEWEQRMEREQEDRRYRDMQEEETARRAQQAEAAATANWFASTPPSDSGSSSSPSGRDAIAEAQAKAAEMSAQRDQMLKSINLKP